MTSMASPQNALSARLVTDPARGSTETCLFTAIMNNRGNLSVMWAKFDLTFYVRRSW